ncbi:MAG: ribonuclease J [Chloroflexi bacterium]|jgi:ribonuclease J|nr:MAG: ribonuclease J [Chloroflexota bacterium]|tara:strand:+ start:6453 stop:8102 length:1650 start_codon:yes stop_codon:yes gene_type:complete
MMEQLKVIPFGGLGEIGKNMMLLEYDNTGIVIDCGIMFPREEHVGVDVIIPDFRYLKKNQKKLKAIFITHGHEDHIGGLPYLLKQINVPVYCSKLAKGLITNKLKEHGLKNKVTVNVIGAGDITQVGPFKAEFFSVAHSIPDAGGYIINTPVGNIVHTGDFKIDDNPIMQQFTDLDRLKEVGNEGVRLLLADSTYAEIPGHTQSEKIVEETLHKLISQSKNRIILSTFASLISRIQIAIDAAEKNDRKIFVTGTSMVNNVGMARQLGYLKIKADTIISKKEVNNIKPSKLLIICTGSQGEPNAVLTRMAKGIHQIIDIKKDDTIILSSNPVPGNEMSVASNINKLFRLGANVIYNKMENVHVRGHAAIDELSIVHKAVKPELFAGIHGEMRHLFLHKKLAIKNGVKKDNAFVLENGDILEITKDKSILLKNKIDSDYIFIDGKGIGDIDEEVLIDRNELSKDGVVVCRINYNYKNKELKETNIFSFGVIKDDLIDDFHNKIIDNIENYFNKLNSERFIDIDEDKISDNISLFISKDIRRRPLVLALLVK